MATLSVVLNKNYKSKKNGTFPLCLQISHAKQTRFIQIDKINLLESQWIIDPKKGMKIKDYPNSERTLNRVLKVYSLAQNFLSDNYSLISNLDINHLKDLILEKVINYKEEDENKIILRSEYLDVYGKIIIGRLKISNDPSKIKTANWYRNSIDSVIKFNNGKDIQMAEIDVSFLEDYKADFMSKLKKTKSGDKKKSLNSLNCYLRGIRAILNKARKEKMKNGKMFLDRDHKPFEDIQIPSQKTGKKGMLKSEINIIRDSILEKGTQRWHHRNYFLFMFNMRGMNWVDLAHLKCNQISNGILTYYRSKTRKTREFKIRLTAEAKDISNYYLQGKNPDDYLFPILSKIFESDAIRLVKVRDQALHLFNEDLKAFAEELKLSTKPTSYTVRHSWSKIAKKAGISTDEIKDSLGHTDFRTTEVYLEDLEDDVLEDVNEIVTGR